MATFEILHPTVHLWLSVYQTYCPMGSLQLWTRDMVTGFAPREDDLVHLSVNDDGESVAEWYVYRHYWRHDGSYHVQLSNMVVDPPAGYRPSRGHYAAAWWTDRDGDPHQYLDRGGWKQWSSQPLQAETETAHSD